MAQQPGRPVHLLPWRPLPALALVLAALATVATRGLVVKRGPAELEGSCVDAMDCSLVRPRQHCRHWQQSTHAPAWVVSLVLSQKSWV